MAVTNGVAEKRPGTGRILYHSLLAIRHDPRILGVFAVTGAIAALVPSVASNLVHLFGIVVGVTFGYRALGGEVTAESSLTSRTGIALVTVCMMAVPVGAGLLLLAVPGLYLIGRWWVVLPAVMIDGRGPIEAMGTSWEAMEDSLTMIGSVVAIVVFSGLMILVPVVQVINHPFLTVTLASTVVGSLLAAGMAALYLQYSRSGAIGEPKRE